MISSESISSFISLCPVDWFREKITIVWGDGIKNSHIPPFACDAPAVIVVEEAGILPSIRQVLLYRYPIQFTLFLKLEDSAVLLTTTLDKLADHAGVQAIYLPVLASEGSSEFFQEVVAHLRAPDGCPWDREQTHESLRPFLLEESYEMLDALDAGDMQGMKEELGDVLLQIYLHAQIASEQGEFSMQDIYSAIASKMIRRHPHVFSTVDVNGDVSQVLRNWQDIKESERRENGAPVTKGILDGVPNSLSALLQAQTYQGRAAAVGFDWNDISGVLEKVEEEIVEIRQAQQPEERAEEVGDLLFALVNLSRWLNLDAESALRVTNRKFARRFAYIEQQAREAGHSLNEMTLEEMDVFWDEAKSLGY